MNKFSLFVLVSMLFAYEAHAAERYVIPIWTQYLAGASGSWTSQITVSNPGGFPVSLRVSRVFPMLTSDCAPCTGEAPVIEIGPYGSRTLYPTSTIPGRHFVAGAFEVEASAPLKFDHVVHRLSGPLHLQRLDVARRWLGPGRHTVHGIPMGTTTNVFVVNPSDEELDIALWLEPRVFNEMRIMVPAESTGVVSLPPRSCGVAPCPPPPPVYPPLPSKLEIDASGPSMVSVSSLGGSWAVFTLADEAGW